MNSLVDPKDVKIVHGHSGRGLQIVCICGCINMYYLESRETRWSCRNCQRAFTHDFPRLVEKVLALGKQEAPAGHSPTATEL